MQLEGGYVRNGTQYNFWAFFPDGELEGMEYVHYWCTTPLI